MTLRYLAMVESRTGERSRQPEFEAFYLRTARLLHGYLSRLSRDPATADEVLQDLGVPLDVSSVFEKLSALDRAALWLAHVEQLSHREMAAILGMKEKSIKVILFRARAKARDLFGKAGLGVPHHE